VVPHFTIYLSETNQTHVPNDIHAINKVLNPIGLVITEEIFESELNPKTAKPVADIAARKPQNLIEELQPYFHTVEKKKDDPRCYSVEELFRMIVYCPSTGEVKEELKQQQA
jgi:hypothetical protein